jgi:glycosidase
MDSLTQYELWQGIWHSIADRNLFELAHAVKRHNSLLATFVPSTFVGNHDVTRIATAVGDRRHLGHALAVLFTVAGTPGVYAGDEYGWHAVKEERHGGDDAIRPAFPDQPPIEQDLSPDERATLGTTRSLISLRRRHPWLHRAHTDVVVVTNTALVLRTATGTAAVITVLNLGDDPVALPAAGATRVEAGNASISMGTVNLAGHQWAVLTG